MITYNDQGSTCKPSTGQILVNTDVVKSGWRAVKMIGAVGTTKSAMLFPQGPHHLLVDTVYK